MKRLSIVLVSFVFIIFSNTVQAQDRRVQTGYPWGGSVYDPRTKTTTSMQVNADGTSKTVVRDEAGKVISEKISHADDFIVPWAEYRDPKTGETTLSEHDLFTGSHVVTKFDREGSEISKRMEHQNIPGNDARVILENEREAIQWRFNLMDQRYEENAVETLRNTFIRRGVKGKSALSYAESWEAQLLVWVDYGSYFYKDHLDALDASIAHLKGQARVYSGDTAYLVQGVKAWVKIHDKLESLFEKMIELMAEKAYELDQATGYADQESKVEDEYLKRGLQAGDDYDYSKAEKEKEAALTPLREKNKEHARLANESDKKIERIREEIINLSKTRVFSSISKSKRVEIPEVPEKAAEALAEVPKPVELVPESPRAETEPTPEKREEEPSQEKSEWKVIEDELSKAQSEFQDINKELDELTRRKIENALAIQALKDVSDERALLDRTKIYGEMAKELKGLKTDELKQAFQRALEEAVNARKFLYQRPGGPAPSSWPLSVRNDLGKAEEEAYKKSYDRQVAKMSLIERRLGDAYNEPQGMQTGYEMHKALWKTADAERKQITKELSEAEWRGVTKGLRILGLEQRLRELER